MKLKNKVSCFPFPFSYYVDQLRTSFWRICATHNWSVKTRPHCCYLPCIIVEYPPGYPASLDVVSTVLSPYALSIFLLFLNNDEVDNWLVKCQKWGLILFTCFLIQYRTKRKITRPLFCFVFYSCYLSWPFVSLSTAAVKPGNELNLLWTSRSVRLGKQNRCQIAVILMDACAIFYRLGF